MRGSTSTMIMFILFLIRPTFSHPDFSYYHTSEQLEQEILSLRDNCDGALSMEILSENPTINLIKIKKPAAFPETEKLKAFFLFGEHAREMISPETGLHLIRAMCSKQNILRGVSSEEISKLLDKYEVDIILNANPESRKKVEEGEHCLRVNENGVDLNRNWDSHFVKGGDELLQTTSGEHAFSEPETKALKKVLDSLKPLVFITVHSGALGMYTPYAYSEEKAKYNEENMMEILRDINPSYCNCQMGAAGKEVGYLCPGTCLDYAYEKISVPYSFAFEIYSRDDRLPASMSLLQLNSKEKRKKGFLSFRDSDDYSCFLQTKSKTKTNVSEMSNAECFEYFNPQSREEYSVTIENWASAFLEILNKIQEMENKRELATENLTKGEILSSTN